MYATMLVDNACKECGAITLPVGPERAGTARSPRVHMIEPVEEMRIAQRRLEGKAEADHDLLIKLDTTLQFICKSLADFQGATNAHTLAQNVQFSAQLKAIEIAMEARIAGISVDLKTNEHACELKMVPIRNDLASIQRFRLMLLGGCIALGAAGSALVKILWH